jgi:preprotein translocase subunit SecF
MAAINFIPHNTKIDFVGKRYISFAISLFIILGTFFELWFRDGLNYGIDFKGGLVVELRTEGPADMAGLRAQISDIVVGDASVQEFGSPNDVLIRVEQQPGGEEGQMTALENIKSVLGQGVDYRRVETVGPKVSEDLLTNGIWAVVCSLFAMLGYIWFRFEWQFGVCALAALVHDCIAILGLFAVFNLEFNEVAIIAILLTATYSINDTVVVYDRVRENLRKYKKLPFAELINVSLNDTLSRTVLTSATTLMAILALYFFGGPVIASFSLPILVGIMAGTFSSIFVAAPLLLFFGVRPDKVTGEAKEA